MAVSAEQLLEAQVAFFLQDFQGESLKRHLEAEAEAYCDLLERISVRQLLDADQVISWVERNVLAYQPTEGFRKQAVMLFEMGLNNPGHQQMPMRQLINRQIYDVMVERVVSRPGLRQEVIHSVLGSPVYHRLLSDVLYHSISDYLMKENPLAKNVPGVSSLMKVGKGMIGKLGNLDQTIEQTIKHYLRHNIRSTAAFSETLVDQALNSDTLRKLADDLWPKLEAYELGQATRHLELEGLSYLAMVFWNQIRQTDYMREQVSYLVKGWYAQSGDEIAMEVLENIGISREQLVREVVALGHPLMTAWMQSGHIEKRLREHLQRFFAHADTQRLLTGAQPA